MDAAVECWVKLSCAHLEPQEASFTLETLAYDSMTKTKIAIVCLSCFNINATLSSILYSLIICPRAVLPMPYRVDCTQNRLFLE